MRSCGLWAGLTALILRKGSVFPALTMLHRAWGELGKNHTVERLEGQKWVPGTSVTALFYFWIGATPCHTSLYPCDTRTAHLREVSCLPVCCVSQNPHHWVILYDFLPRHHSILPATRRNWINIHPARQHLKKLCQVEYLPHPPQSNHWPLSSTLGLGFSCLAQRTRAAWQWQRVELFGYSIYHGVKSWPRGARTRMKKLPSLLSGKQSPIVPVLGREGTWRGVVFGTSRLS